VCARALHGKKRAGRRFYRDALRVAQRKGEIEMASLTDEQIEFLNQPYVGVVTTLRPDGSPHNTVVWVDVEDGAVSFNTARGRAKPRHLENDRRAAVIVVDPQNAFKWVAVDGAAEMTTDGADSQIDRLAKKYMGVDEYPYRQEGEERMKVRIAPERVSSSGFDGEG
jgi:PPOX class probable F420-dependent enzyme